MPRLCAPALAVSGLSGSGKTTLLEAVIPRLISNGISVGVVKHDAHGIQLDTSGKDSDRLFRAGATVALRGPDLQLLRRQSSSSLSLYATLEILSHDHDLLLVEGHKNTPLPKFWLEDGERNQIPSDVTNIVGVLNWNANRIEHFLAFVEGWLQVAWKRRPVFRGLVAGHEMFPAQPAGSAVEDHLTPRPQHTEIGDVALLGPGTAPSEFQGFPRIPHPPGIDGPFAALLAAHRWAPSTAWVFMVNERSAVTSSFADWLVSMRAPGKWSVIPRQGQSAPCLLAGLFEPQALVLVERHFVETSNLDASIDRLMKDRRTLIIDVPREHIQRLCGVQQQTAWSGHVG